jgi:hypothetical protein
MLPGPEKGCPGLLAEPVPAPDHGENPVFPLQYYVHSPHPHERQHIRDFSLAVYKIACDVSLSLSTIASRACKSLEVTSMKR